MQALKRATSASAGLAAQLDAHWTEIARFLTSRRLRSSLYAGAPELSPAQLQALGALSEDELRIGELAARLGLAESTVTRLVDRLEAAGLARRRTSKPDRRCVVAELTVQGRRLAGELETNRRHFLAEILGTLGAEERRELVRLFAKVTDALRQHEPAAATGEQP